MNYKNHQEAITSIYLWVSGQRKSVMLKRGKEKSLPKKIMLGGKAKAYTDTAYLIKARFGKDLLIP